MSRVVGKLTFGIYAKNKDADHAAQSVTDLVGECWFSHVAAHLCVKSF